jgi:hypothetical protein
MTKNVTIYHRDGRERTLDVHEASRLAGTGTVGADKEWSFHKPPPIGWERETPKYRVAIQGGVYPSPNSRHRFEPPFASASDTAVWQYADRAYKVGEIIETREWPHASFQACNYAAEKVLEFFNSRMKSRFTRSPWLGDSVRLEDGLGGPMIIHPTAPQLEPVKTVRAYADTR